MRRDFFQNLKRIVEGCSVLLNSPARSFASMRPNQSLLQTRSTSKPVTLREIRQKYLLREPLTMVTAYDYPSAVHIDISEIDMLLVGDSASMVVHGHETTLPITLDEMIRHCQSVSRGANRPFIVGDLPFGSYEASKEIAVLSATRIIKEGFVDAIKLEGGSPSRVVAAKAIFEAGISVMGHVGLAPQMISSIGGFHPQAQTAEHAMVTIDQAIALEESGCFALVLECVPAAVGAALQKVVNIPVIGIGAGPAVAGQVLVYHDLLGFVQHAHHAKVTPKFCKRYAEVGDAINKALSMFNQEVKNKSFPEKRYSPYPMEKEELEKLCIDLDRRGFKDASEMAEKEFQTTHQISSS